ncbi:aminoacyl-tRNA hydrolase [Fusibacter paucivorans]|uniref:Peptidyl-tRNA hydrolase n=1 Tax=Fusibacter paucivorans TaxID=76009 RepID=A0ABS5PQ36_9FIRM|nr:aminoacyl-tRNA hydrolase [Fusibacter paucivorans]MBS7527255.1 aminoacyl-tRNA hydrolase [Fusibacter paucivorans]
MYIIVGLGNPGKKYAGTRHNVGFELLDQLAEAHGIKVDKIKFKALIGEGFIGSEKVVLVKPQTFMNLSGESVREVMHFYKVDETKLIVLYDDIDTAFGKLRIRKKGSAGTHNGMRNIIYLLQTDGFPRIRIGIGSPERGDLRDFVLNRFSKDERAEMALTLERAGKAIALIVDGNVDGAMNQFNG